MKKVFICILSFCFLTVNAQVNKGMPDIQEVARTFFSKYVWAYHGETDIQFEKRATGWFIRQDAMQPSAPMNPSVKFWDRASASYIIIPYEHRTDSDSAGEATELASFEHRKLDMYQIYFYQRLNFYGYNGWDWDIIQLLNGSKSMTDTLLESDGLANTHYALGYIGIAQESLFVNGDSNRQMLADSLPIGPERVSQFKRYTNRSIESWTKLSKINPAYKTLNSVGRYSPSMVKMEAYTILQFLGYEKEGREYLENVRLPDSLMKNMKQVLDELAPNSILLADNDVQNAVISYWQARGLRRDIIFIFEPSLVIQRSVQWLDRKYPKSLLGVDSTVYMNPVFMVAYFDPQKADNRGVSLSEFLIGLETSPALRSTGDDLIRYDSKTVYLEVDKKRAEKLYGPGPFNDRLRIPIENDYLLISDMIWLSIVNKNFLERKIYFLYPYYKNLSGTGIRRHGLYFELSPN